MDSQKKQKKKQKIKKLQENSPELPQKEEILKDREKSKPTGKKRERDKGSYVDIGKAVWSNVEDGPIKAKKTKESSRKKNRNDDERNAAMIGSFDQLNTEAQVEFDNQHDDGVANGSHFQSEENIECSEGLREADIETEIQTRKSKKTKRKRKRNEDPDSSKKGKKSLKKGEADQNEVNHLSPGDEGCSKGMKGNSKKARMKKKKDQNSSKEAENLQEKRGEADQDNVYQISSVDEDCSKGMQKWIMEYHQSRPGLKVLQQKIDDFITAHDAQLEQEKKEREAQAAVGGWTVVAHHKGRKKTTDAESGIAVGSVAQVVVENKMANKKPKEVGSDFYRFLRREAHREEIMILQSKVEQDRKRIQQHRAARKFRPY